MDHLPMPKLGRWPDYALSSPVSKSPGRSPDKCSQNGGGSYLIENVAWPTPFAFNRTTRSSPAAICMRCR